MRANAQLIDVDSAFRTNFARSGHIPGDEGVSGCDPDRALSETQAVDGAVRRMRLFFARPTRPATPIKPGAGAGAPDPRRLPEWIAATLRVFSTRVFGVEIKPRLTNGYNRAAVAVGSGDDGPNGVLIAIPAYRLPPPFGLPMLTSVQWRRRSVALGFGSSGLVENSHESRAVH